MGTRLCLRVELASQPSKGQVKWLCTFSLLHRLRGTWGKDSNGNTVGSRVKMDGWRMKRLSKFVFIIILLETACQEIRATTTRQNIDQKARSSWCGSYRRWALNLSTSDARGTCYPIYISPIDNRKFSLLYNGPRGL